MTYYVHFGAGAGPFLTLGFKSYRAARNAVRDAIREGGYARMQGVLKP